MWGEVLQGRSGQAHGRSCVACRAWAPDGCRACGFLAIERRAAQASPDHAPRGELVCSFLAAPLQARKAKARARTEVSSGSETGFNAPSPAEKLSNQVLGQPLCEPCGGEISHPASRPGGRGSGLHLYLFSFLGFPPRIGNEVPGAMARDPRGPPRAKDANVALTPTPPNSPNSQLLHMTVRRETGAPQRGRLPGGTLPETTRPSLRGSGCWPCRSPVWWGYSCSWRRNHAGIE